MAKTLRGGDGGGDDEEEKSDNKNRLVEENDYLTVGIWDPVVAATGGLSFQDVCEVLLDDNNYCAKDALSLSSNKSSLSSTLFLTVPHHPNNDDYTIIDVVQATMMSNDDEKEKELVDVLEKLVVVLETMGALCDVICLGLESEHDLDAIIPHIQRGMDRKRNAYSNDKKMDTTTTRIIFHFQNNYYQIEPNEEGILSYSKNVQAWHRVPDEINSMDASVPVLKHFWDFTIQNTENSHFQKDVPQTLFPTLLKQVMKSQITRKRQSSSLFDIEIKQIQVPSPPDLIDTDSEDQVSSSENTVEQDQDLIIDTCNESSNASSTTQFTDKQNPKLDAKQKQEILQHSDDSNKNQSTLFNSIWMRGKKSLSILQEKVENYAFHPGIEKNSVPILEFGTNAQKILINALKYGKELKDEKLDDVSICRLIAGDMSKLNHDIHHDRNNIYILFQQHIQNLREYYGCGYETILDNYLEKNNIEGEDEEDDRMRRNAIWSEAARTAMEDFRTAANYSIPKICMDVQELFVLYNSYVTSELEGLIRDLMEATQMRQPFDDEDDNGDNNGMTTPCPKRPKWYKKLAARALALGVNYLQGWLALQGIRKAALERDQAMPKFPIF